MSATVKQRFNKLEGQVRAGARTKLKADIDASFEPALQAAANDAGIVKNIQQARADLFKAKRASAENEALETFLTAKESLIAPALINLDALYAPVQVRIAANGERLPDTAKDYAAVLLPQFDLLYTVETWAASNWKHAIELGSKVELFDGKGQWQLWDDVEASLTIDRSRHGPAVLPAFVGCTPTDDWYWTRRPLASSPSGLAIYVILSSGRVYWSSQHHAGRVRAVRRVRASQF